MNSTSTEAVSLHEALRHGDAVHQHGYPWRIRNGQPEVGIPRIDEAGLPKRSNGDLVLDWEPLSVKKALARWSLGGWILT